MVIKYTDPADWEIWAYRFLLDLKVKVDNKKNTHSNIADGKNIYKMYRLKAKQTKNTQKRKDKKILQQMNLHSDIKFQWTTTSIRRI